MRLVQPDNRPLLLLLVLLAWVMMGCASAPEPRKDYGGVTSFRITSPQWSYQKVRVRVKTPTGEQVHTAEEWKGIDR